MLENGRLYQFALHLLRVRPLAYPATLVARACCRAAVSLRALCAPRRAQGDEKALRAALSALCPPPEEAPYDQTLAPRDTAVDVSVIVPLYNARAYAQGALDALLSQETACRFEVIAVDDGSTDGTAEALAPYRSDPRVRLIRQDNQGAAAARNAGLALAAGGYVMFADADDEVLPGALDALWTRALATGADIVQGSWRFLNADGTAGASQRFPDALYERERFMELLALPGTPWAKLYRRELFAGAFFPPRYRAFEDTNIKMLALPRAKRVATSAAMVYAWRRNPTGITFSAVKQTRSILTCWIVETMLARAQALQIPRDALYTALLLRQLGPINERRLRELDENVKKAAFGLSRRLYEAYDGDKTAKLPYPQALQQRALARGDYGLWSLLGKMNDWIA